MGVEETFSITPEPANMLHIYPGENGYSFKSVSLSIYAGFEIARVKEEKRMENGTRKNLSSSPKALSCKLTQDMNFSSDISNIPAPSSICVRVSIHVYAWNGVVAGFSFSLRENPQKKNAGVHTQRIY